MPVAERHGIVEKLYLRPRVEMAPGHSLTCIAGYGINGEQHANRLSPRQVLITLASELEALSIAPGALFENIVISLPTALQFKPGSALVFESGVEIRLTMFCEPCKVIGAVARDLKKMLRRRGILGLFVHGGELRRGETFTLIPARYRPLPDSMQQRFADFLATVPPGRVVRYLDVTVAMGVDASFIRALPGYIRRASALSLPLHRIVNARGELLAFVPGQAGLLVAEGVTVNGNCVDLTQYCWQG